MTFVYRVGSAPHFNAVELGRHLFSRTIFKQRRTAALAEWRQLVA